MDIVIIVAIAIVGLGVFIFIPQVMTKRALPRVIKAFRQGNAVGATNAKTLIELGLSRQGLRLLGRRDYTVQALQVLMQCNVVKTCDDGRVYLSEEDLAATRLKDS